MYNLTTYLLIYNKIQIKKKKLINEFGNNKEQITKKTLIHFIYLELYSILFLNLVFNIEIV